MNKIAILQSNYIPWKGYFDIIQKSDVFVIYDEVQYTKNDWRNRNKIKTSNGLQWLTIPTRQKTLYQKIYETEISDNVWHKKHFNALKYNYAKAPFFKEIITFVEELYLCDCDLLSDINNKFIREICHKLEIKTQIIDSRELNLEGDKNTKLVDACKKLNGQVYISGPAAKNYLQEELFKNNDVQIEWMSYNHYSEYPQLYPPFEHGVTILDMLFNLGFNGSKSYLKLI